MSPTLGHGNPWNPGRFIPLQDRSGIRHFGLQRNPRHFHADLGIRIVWPFIFVGRAICVEVQTTLLVL
jgi:hypothetical protein